MLVLTASPRKGGNSDKLADAFISGAKQAPPRPHSRDALTTRAARPPRLVKKGLDTSYPSVKLGGRSSGEPSATTPTAQAVGRGPRPE
jgi:hypothetical protein